MCRMSLEHLTQNNMAAIKTSVPILNRTKLTDASDTGGIIWTSQIITAIDWNIKYADALRLIVTIKLHICHLYYILAQECNY